MRRPRLTKEQQVIVDRLYMHNHAAIPLKDAMFYCLEVAEAIASNCSDDFDWRHARGYLDAADVLETAHIAVLNELDKL